MLRLLCAPIIALPFFACHKNQQTPAAGQTGTAYIRYVIPRGEHYAAGNAYRTVRISKLLFSALFDSSCLYRLATQDNAGDINKLYGFSDCHSAHHVNSARFGWRWYDGALQIFAYCYTNGARQTKLMGSIPVGKAATMSITIEPGQYLFELNGRRERMERNCTADYAEGYQLYPYFGGDEPAPHNITIRIRELKEMPR